VTPVPKPSTQAFIDALAAAGGLDIATEIQAVRLRDPTRRRARGAGVAGPILERVPFSKE
jgi:hypothetical protein